MENQSTEKNSFTKKDRLLKRSDFVRLSGSGKKRVNAHFVLFFVQSKTDKSRLGVTASKKVGCAVVRNRIKRICREYFRRNRHKITGTWDISLIARKSIAGLPSDQVNNSLKSLLEKI
jgi:ribonuclease P protein component